MKKQSYSKNQPRFQPGEHVRLLHSREEGKVIQICSDGSLLVLVDDLLEMTLNADEIIPLNPKKEVRETRIPDLKQALKPGLYLAIELGGRIRYHLINASDYELIYTLFSQQTDQSWQGKVSSRVDPWSVQFLFLTPKENWTDDRLLSFQFLFFRSQSKLLPMPEQVRLELRDKHFLKKPVDVPGMDRPCVLQALLVAKKPEPRVPDALMDEEEPISPDSPDTPDRVDCEATEEVVDLHIECLVESPDQLDAAEMLQIQLDVFERCLSRANAHRMPHITFIHGVGAGILKKEIHNRLKTMSFVRRFSLDDSRRYGTGATKVFLG